MDPLKYIGCCDCPAASATLNIIVLLLPDNVTLFPPCRYNVLNALHVVPADFVPSSYQDPPPPPAFINIVPLSFDIVILSLADIVSEPEEPFS